MRKAIDADVPVLGLCFGGQMLARALGAEVFRRTKSEIGWLPVRSTDPELVPDGPWFQWHFDSFTVPPGATLIAESDVGPQAFVAGRSLGLQFHPEVTTQIMDDWVRAYRHELDGDGVDPDDAPRGDEAPRGREPAERVAAVRAIPPRRRRPHDRTAAAARGRPGRRTG